MFWKLVKNIRSGKKTSIKGIKNENGEIKTEETEILEVWSNYFEKLLNDGTNGNNDVDIIPDIETHPEAISILEMEKSIKSLKLVAKRLMTFHALLCVLTTFYPSDLYI